MNVWKLQAELNLRNNYAFASLRTTSKEDNALFFNHFNGVRHLPKGWQPISLVRKPIDDEEPEYRELGDFAVIDAYGGILNLSQRALDTLLPHIASYGEVLPVLFDEAAFAIFNVTNVVDALDEQASDVKYFTSSGRVMAIDRFVFKPELVKNEWIFKIPQCPEAHNFVTDRFVQVVRDAGLRGFGFTKVWSDEA
jgi:hypothetical protein